MGLGRVGGRGRGSREMEARREVVVVVMMVVVDLMMVVAWMSLGDEE